MNSFNTQPGYPSALSLPSIPRSIALLAIAVAACGGMEPAQSSLVPALPASLSSGSPVPSLGTAANFAVLASTAVTCTDATVAGNVGVSPGNTITQTSCPVTGTIDAGDATAAQAHTDFLTAYAAFAALPCGQTLTTLDGLTLSPGIYCFDAAATSTGGVLTLNGPSNGTWIFKVGTLGTGALTGTNFSVVTSSGTAPACGSVYWWVAEAVTLTDSKFVGTVLAGQAITLTRGTFNGDAYSKAAITITGDVVTSCALGGGNPPPSCRGKDFVTGGGWIKTTPSGAKGTFGVSGGTRHGAFRGHLTYQDHRSGGPEVKSTSVTGYLVLDSTTRRISGNAQLNGRDGFTWQADVTDNGEPGRNDKFSLRVSGANGAFAYGASGNLAGGNIKLHKAGDACDKDDDHEGDDHEGDDD